MLNTPVVILLQFGLIWLTALVEATDKGSVSVATETLGLRGHGEKLMFGILQGQDKLLLEAQPRLQRRP